MCRYCEEPDEHGDYPSWRDEYGIEAQLNNHKHIWKLILSDDIAHECVYTHHVYHCPMCGRKLEHV